MKIINCYQKIICHHFRNGDPIFGTLTSLFVICPVVVYLIMDFVHFKKTGKRRNGIFGFFWQLPLVKLAKYWEYLIQLANHIKQQKVLRALKKDIHEKMKHNSGFSNDKLWHFEEVLLISLKNLMAAFIKRSLYLLKIANKN